MLSTVIVIWMGLVLEDGMRKNGKLERGQRGCRQDCTKERDFIRDFKAQKSRNSVGLTMSIGGSKEYYS